MHLSSYQRLTMRYALLRSLHRRAIDQAAPADATWLLAFKSRTAATHRRQGWKRYEVPWRCTVRAASDEQIAESNRKTNACHDNSVESDGRQAYCNALCWACMPPAPWPPCSAGFASCTAHVLARQGPHRPCIRNLLRRRWLQPTSGYGTQYP